MKPNRINADNPNKNIGLNALFTISYMNLLPPQHACRNSIRLGILPDYLHTPGATKSDSFSFPLLIQQKSQRSELLSNPSDHLQCQARMKNTKPIEGHM